MRNITDVDDKTIRRSIEEGLSLGEFTAKWTEKFHADCDALNMRPPSIEPSAVAHIPQQIALVETLIEKGHAYSTDDGSVYFRVNSFEDYGRLSASNSANSRLKPRTPQAKSTTPTSMTASPSPTLPSGKAAKPKTKATTGPALGAKDALAGT